MDMGAGYAITPWLEVGPELGFSFNGLDEVGDWSYPDSSVGQILMMMNVRLEYPPQSRLAPFIGAGVGGAASFLTFGSHYDYYYYDDADGTAADFVLAYQAFAGLRYRVADNWNIGLMYRYQVAQDLNWDVDWWSGADFDVGVESIRTHCVCLLFSANF
jgi:opacity protein-like surface antigen